jgi:hypothetical protein
VPGAVQSGRPEIRPEPGADPRSIVSGFLEAAVSSDASHSGSRQFLSSNAQRRWQDSTVVIVDSYRVQVPDVRGPAAVVTATGRRVGQLDNHGVFSPVLKGDGVGDTETFTFGLKKTNNEWRIDQLQPGILITQADFESSFKLRPLYFFDAGGARLVPDLRYSDAIDQALASWLLTQLIAGPRQELLAAVRNEVPDQIEPRRASVTVGDKMRVEIPGTSQIDKVGRLRLAAQLANTLGLVQFSSTLLTLTDSGQQVDIPTVGPDFNSDDVPKLGPTGGLAASTAYYVRNGSLISGLDDRPISGPLGAGRYNLSYVALRRATGGRLTVAAVADKRLRLGSVEAGLQPPISLRAGPLTRPEWQPHSDQAWVGVGGSIVRVGGDSRPHQVSLTSTRGGLPAGQFTALRFSPDGARLAVIVHGADGVNAVWIGSVVRSGTDVRIEAFEPVTPSQLDVRDLAWSDPTTLLLSARKGAAEVGFWSVQSDGSSLASRSTVGLPCCPLSIAAAPGQLPLVEAGGALWIQRGSSWSALVGTQTLGRSPVYPN